MALDASDIARYINFASALEHTPRQDFYLAYDAEADIAYINFHNPATPAEDSEIRDDDVIIRYDEAGKVIGLTILHISQRATTQFQATSHNYLAILTLGEMEDIQVQRLTASALPGLVGAA